MGVLLLCEKIKKFLAVRQVWAWWPIASVVLTVHFPIKWLGIGGEPGPPNHGMGLSCLFKPRFLSLTLRHRNAVTWTCDQHAWFSFIHIHIDFTLTFCNKNFWSLESAFLLFELWCFFSGPWPLVWDSWPPLSFAILEQPPPPDHLENHLIWADSIRVIPLACCRMSLELLSGPCKFPNTLVTLSLQLWN